MRFDQAGQESWVLFFQIVTGVRDHLQLRRRQLLDHESPDGGRCDWIFRAENEQCRCGDVR